MKTIYHLILTKPWKIKIFNRWEMINKFVVKIAIKVRTENEFTLWQRRKLQWHSHFDILKLSTVYGWISVAVSQMHCVQIKQTKGLNAQVRSNNIFQKKPPKRLIQNLRWKKMLHVMFVPKHHKKQSKIFELDPISFDSTEDFWPKQKKIQKT